MDYKRQTGRFTYRGVCLNAAIDDIPDDKLAIATNVRPNQQGTLSTRPAITSVVKPTSTALHSVKSFNAGGANHIYSGAGANLYRDAATTPIDTGYSGNPLTWASYQPASAVQPFLYVADSARYSKIRSSDGARFNVGAAPPAGPPNADIGAPLYSVINDFESLGSWASTGVGGVVTVISRVPASTTVAAILYDSGTTGWACVAFNSSATMWLSAGARIIVNAESQVVSQVVPAALGTTTTVAAIQYDSGTSGPACVVLTKNTSVLERNALIKINAEYVRVLSVAIGEDNSISFRCSTVSTHVAGEAVTFYDAARMYFVGTHAAGESVTGNALSTAFNVYSGSSATGVVSTAGSVVTWNSGTQFTTGTAWNGVHIVINSNVYTVLNVSSATSLTLTTVIGTLTSVSYSVSPTSSTGALLTGNVVDLSQISNRPISGDDWVHISLAVDNPANLSSIQLYLNTDSNLDFQHNGYWANITSNLFQQASTGAQSLLSAQQSAVTVQSTASQLNELYALQNQLATLQSSGYPYNPGLASQIAGLQSAIAQLTSVLLSQGVNPSAPISTPSAQLAVGTLAWSEIFIPVSTFLSGRIGSDESLTLADVNAIMIQVVSTGPLNLYADSWWIGGTYGPNCPEGTYPDNPIEYCFRYRSTITGAQSTWSPLTRGGVFPQRMPVVISGTGSADAQVDTVDIARVGASVNGTPQQLVSLPNTTNWSYTDNFSDAQLGSQITQTDFQPWPVQQVPITGTCNVVGTTVFDTSAVVPSNLCTGTTVLVNGVGTTIRGAPTTVTGHSTFQIADNVAPGTAVQFQINSPTTYGNPLPYLAGPFDETFFAWGDLVNPGRLYFSNRTDPESANTSNFLDLTSSAEPGLGICTWNGYVVAMTERRFFAGTISGNATNPYAFAETSVGAGLLVPWAFDVGPQIFFLGRGGLMATDLGPAKNLGGLDLYPFLPHEGVAGVAVNGYSPPVLSPAPRLSYSRDGWLYFDYQTLAATQASLALNLASPGWWVDSYTPGVTLHAQGEASGSFITLCGCSDGSVQQLAAASADSGGAISCAVRTNAWNFGDLRARKQWGDAFVDCDSTGSVAGVVVAILGDNWASSLATQTLTGARSPNRLPTDVSSGHGSFNVNAALDLSWQGLATLYGYDLTALLIPSRTQLRTTDWIDLGQSVYLQGLRVTANTGGVARTVAIEYDGYPGAGGTFNVTMTHAGEVQLPYSFGPVIAHRIRLTPSDAGDTWELFSVEPIGPKAPEAVTTWNPQPTSHGLSGYQTVREVRPVVQGSGICNINAVCEFGQFTVSLLMTGAVQKAYIPCPVNKGMLYAWSVYGVGGAAVRVFADEFEVVVKQWGAGGAFSVVRPFGESGTEGARI